MWLTSDTHFGHTNIIKYSERPFETVEEMNAILIQNWNAVVGRRDVVWHLGDFAYDGRAGVLKYAPQLNGKIHVLIGNHDNPNHLAEAFGSGRVFDTREIKYQGTRIFLSHYAHRVWPSSHKGSFHAYGHSHGNLDIQYGPWGRSMDVGVDCHGYGPLHIDKFLAYLKDQPVSLHHPDSTWRNPSST